MKTKTAERRLTVLLNDYKLNVHSIEYTIDKLLKFSHTDGNTIICKCGCAIYNYSFDGNFKICTRCGNERKNH